MNYVWGTFFALKMAAALNELKKPLEKKWNENETLRFMKLYEEVQWNVKNVNYKKRNARDSALPPIVESLKMLGVEVQDELKKINIRSSFWQEKTKRQQFLTL